MKTALQSLTKFETEQSGVRKIIEYVEGRLEKLRVQNDSLDNDATYIRGRIAEIKAFQRLLKNMEK